MKDLIQEGRTIQENFKRNVIQEDLFKKLINAIQSGISSAMVGDYKPGTKLLDMWKDGTLYKDTDSPYSKSVSWYDEGKIKAAAAAYDAADKAEMDVLKKGSQLKDKICSNPKNPTPEDQEKLSKSKEYLTLTIDLLTKGITSLTKRHELELALGMKDKNKDSYLSVSVYDEKTGDYKGETMDKEILYKRWPKEWVDEMDLDSPVKPSIRIEDYKEKIEIAKKQLDVIK